MQCSRCGFVANQASPFCPSCGTQTGFGFPVQNLQTWPPTPQSPPYGQHAVRARGFGQVFGIHPLIASLTLIVDLMLFGGEVATMGAILPVSIGAGGGAGVDCLSRATQVVWRRQGFPTIKALVLGFLTAIPTPCLRFFRCPRGSWG